MIGVVDVGGGLRGSYGAGVFDYCMDNGINFSYCIGVSAGSANLASYISGQRGRNYRYYTEYAMRKEYMSLRNFIRCGSYVDLEYVYSYLANTDGEDPMDYNAFCKNPARFVVVATDALTGNPVYFEKSDLSHNRYDTFKASSALPIACCPYKIKGRPYYDGGISDPLPYDRAFSDGCDKVVLVLTRPKEYRRSHGKIEIGYGVLLRKYPLLAAALKRRSDKYNEDLERAIEMEKSGRILIVAPDSIEGMKTLSRDKEAIIKLYEKGYDDGQAIGNFVNQL